MNNLLTVLTGDALTMLRTLPDESVQMCVTSPPYFGLRNYAMPGQIGLERTLAEYVAKLVDVFREVRRVLRNDGTLWLNLGDSFNAYNGNRGPSKGINKNNHDALQKLPTGHGLTDASLKPKDLIGIPWSVAFALRADGWYLRQDIIWSKPNPMPESVTDRCTKAHEYIFLLTKSERYFYDAVAISEPVSVAMLKQVEEGYDGIGLKDYEAAGVQNPSSVNARKKQKIPSGWDTKPGSHGTIHRNGRSEEVEHNPVTTMTRNKRSVWTVPTCGYKEAHFATFPPNLIKPCILAGSKPGNAVLDPFGGSGTTGFVALEIGRRAILIELNPEYVVMIHDRCNVTPGLAL